MGTNSPEERIFDYIKANPRKTAREMAGDLGIERRLVNQALYGPLKGRVFQDKQYRWSLRSALEVGLRASQEPKQLATPLAKLCRYYLDCLSYEDLGDVSELASPYGLPNYLQLETLPMLDGEYCDPFRSEQALQFLKRIQKDRNRQSIFLGYPVLLKLVRSKKGWEGFIIEPILLFTFQEADKAYASSILSDDLPYINFKALKSLTNATETSLMEEAILLADELGLSSAADEQPDIDELLIRLSEIRAFWPWQEEMNPYVLNISPHLAELNQQGIFNRAILIAADRSPFTRGLESELRLLQTVEETTYSQTSLGTWLKGQVTSAPQTEEQPLLEVLPLNTEQRQALRQALSNQLTVITGPPGTGKSQLVMSILVNAAWQGRTVLFASKNNKAVDVVETRLNAIGPRPVLLRLGREKYQSRLAEHISSLLAATATQSDHAKYQEYLNLHNYLMTRSFQIDSKIQALIDLRNKVDNLEQSIEVTRHNIGQATFNHLRNINRNDLKLQVVAFLAAVDQASIAKQSVFVQLVWFLVRNKRFESLYDSACLFRDHAQSIGLCLPETEPTSANIQDWIRSGASVAKRMTEVGAIEQYFADLALLSRFQTLEESNLEHKTVADEISYNSDALWNSWLKLQPARINQQERWLLGDFCSKLQLGVSTKKLFSKIAPLLSCWAVTSLSARGKLPFSPAFFDLLVIDEASQCDIASALPLLYRARNAVILGDPKQLPHITSLSKNQDKQLLSKHDLMDDFTGWAYSTRSLYDLASTMCRGEDIVTLRDHFRSHSDIISFSNNAFYDGTLRVATNYDKLRIPAYGDPAVRWIDVVGTTIRPKTGGARNQDEAVTVVNEMRRLVHQGYGGSIGVVSPFREQANLIKQMVFEDRELNSYIPAMDFLSDTVHKFQGDERDVMFFSPAVSTGISDGCLIFLRRNPNLFNVAITRARAALVVVGNKGAIMNSGVDYLSQFAAYSEMVGRRREEPGILKQADFGAEYPAVSKPDRVSKWEHLFYRALYDVGIRPIPQYEEEKYVLDFAVFKGQRRLNIEIDGECYHRNWDGELCRRDQIRNQRLMELGWDVMRFWVYQVRDDLDRCIGKVQDWLNQ
jgi:very-short-patch-repair endonuclease